MKRKPAVLVVGAGPASAEGFVCPDTPRSRLSPPDQGVEPPERWGGDVPRGPGDSLGDPGRARPDDADHDDRSAGDRLPMANSPP